LQPQTPFLIDNQIKKPLIASKINQKIVRWVEILKYGFWGLMA